MIALALATLLAAGHVEENRSFRVSATPSVEVSNINGEIRVEAGAEGRVEVRASGKDAGDFTTRIEQQGDRVVAAVCCDGHCPGDHSRERSGDGNDDQSWDDRRRCERGQVDLTLRVPPGTQLLARNVSGPIAVTGVRGDQELKNVSGTVATGGSEGRLQIKGVSGDIRIAPGRVARTSVKTVSGDIELALPRGAGANLSLQSLSGTLEGADGGEDDQGEGHPFPHGRRSRQKKVVGGGGPDVTIKSVSGSVKLAGR